MFNGVKKVVSYTSSCQVWFGWGGYGWARIGGMYFLALTIKLTSHYKADYVKVRGTLLDPISSGTDSDSVYVVLIIRRIESAAVQPPNWMPFLVIPFLFLLSSLPFSDLTQRTPSQVHTHFFSWQICDRALLNTKYNLICDINLIPIEGRVFSVL